MSGTDFTTTPNLGLYKPTYNADAEQWGNHLNANADRLDAVVGVATVVNVLAFGAKGDGVTDDTAAIQNVLNTYAGKAVVLIPDTGDWYMITTLTVPTGTDFLIHGKLKLLPNSHGTVVNSNANNVTIRGHGTIDGNSVNNTGNSWPTSCIGLDHCSNVFISGLTLQNATTWNFTGANLTHIRLNDMTILHGGNANQFVGPADDCWLMNCMIDGPTGDFGFAFYGGVTNSGAIGNTVRNAAAGIFVYADNGSSQPCENITISDNIVYNNAGGGIVSDCATGALHLNVIISGNRCYGNNTNNNAINSEVWVDHSYNAVVNGNLVSSGSNSGNAGSYGIGVGANADTVSVTGNLIFNIGASGIPGTGLHIDSANYVSVSGNQIHDFRAPRYMTASIGGNAAIGSCFIGNSCDTPVSITPASDTVLANSVQGNLIMANLPTSAGTMPNGGVWRNGTVLNIV